MHTQLVVDAARRNLIVEIPARGGDVISRRIGAGRRGVEVREGLPHFVNAVRWNDVVRKRHLSEWIYDSESTLRHKTEIAGTFSRRRHQGCAADSIALSGPFVVVKEEGLIPAIVEL